MVLGGRGHGAEFYRGASLQVMADWPTIRASFCRPEPDANRLRRTRRTAQYPLSQGDPLEASDDTAAAVRLAHRGVHRRGVDPHVLVHLPGGARGRRREHGAGTGEIGLLRPCLLASTPVVLRQVPVRTVGARAEVRFPDQPFG